MVVVTQQETEVILKVDNLKKYFFSNSFPEGKSIVKAVDDISFYLQEGETFGLVGESGCGKSTTGRTILRLTEPTEGNVFYKDTNLIDLNEGQMRNLRKDLQMIFQDPYSSLNPKKRIGQLLEEPLKVHKMGNKEERTRLVLDALNRVGMRPDSYYKYPHEFSGGQLQRIGIARALVINPKIIICDEPVSALDVSVQAQILNLLKDIQKQLKITYLFIAHDLSVVRHISDRVGVMYLGNLVEEAPTDELFGNPLHPYTKALLSAVPEADPHTKREKIQLKGELPSPLNPPSGCVFHTRCPLAIDTCKTMVPIRKEVAPKHFVKCNLV